MKNKFNKSYKFLSLFSLSNLETYLQELVGLSFEYSSNFILTYNVSSFKNMPIILKDRHLLSNFQLLSTFFYLVNSYLSKDPFYTSLYSYLICKFKIKFSQFSQVMFIRGGSGTKNSDTILFSDLNHGLTYKDFILSAFKTRDNIIDSSVNVYTSGYLTRKLVEGLRNIHIKDINCKTKYNCRCPITDENVNIPFLCSNNRSICSFCLNIRCDSNIFMGVNKGVVSGQALGEPSTQMLLRTFHLGAEGAKAEDIRHGDFSFDCLSDYKFMSLIYNSKFYVLNNSYKLNNKGKASHNYYYSKFKCYNNTAIFKHTLKKYLMVLYNKFIKIWSLIICSKNNIQSNALKENLKINYDPIKVYAY